MEPTTCRSARRPRHSPGFQSHPADEQKMSSAILPHPAKASSRRPSGIDLAIIGAASVKKRAMGCCQIVGQLVGGQQTSFHTTRRPNARAGGQTAQPFAPPTDKSSDNRAVCADLSGLGALARRSLSTGACWTPCVR